MSEYYAYDQVAGRITAGLGRRPSNSTLRAAATAADRGLNQRVRVTVGIPAPEPERVNRRTVFSAEAIDSRLRNHPSRTVHQALTALAQTPVEERDQTVGAARRAGFSWSQITAAISRADGVRRTRQWAQWRYKSLLPTDNGQPT